MRAIRRLSFTWRLLIAGFLLALVPVVVAYLAMVHLPQRVGNDALELQLRGTAQGVSDSIREERVNLREDVDGLLDDARLKPAILSNDRPAIAQLLAPESTSTYTYDFQVDPTSEQTTASGPIHDTVQMIGGGQIHTLLVWVPLTGKVLNAFGSTTSTPAAIVDPTHTVASSAGFPSSLRASDFVGPDGTPLNGEVTLKRDGHSYRSLVIQLQDADDLSLAVVATPALEHSTIAGPRRDILQALIGLALATALLAAAGVGGINRVIRGFSRRTRALADGDYAARLPVNGNDSFAELAESFNVLASELQQRMTDLEEAADRYVRTLETIEDGVCLWDADEVIQLWNRGASKLTGVELSDVDEEHPVITRLREERRPGTRRITLPSSRSAQGLIVDLVVTPVAGGGTLQTFRDITAVEILHQTRRNFMATAAHEIRTPLTTILGFSQTLTDDHVQLTDEQREEFLLLITEQAQQLRRLTDAFFTNSQLANDRVEVTLVQLNLRTVVETSIDRFGSIDGVGAAGDVRVEIAPALTVFGDERALIGVLVLLLDNAHKYGSVPIEVSAEALGDRVVLRVTDAGGSIDHQHLDRLFDPFYRIDTDMRSGIGGAGLGLFTARKLVTAMRGTIAATSDHEHGTSLVMELASTAYIAADERARKTEPDSLGAVTQRSE